MVCDSYIEDIWVIDSGEYTESGRLEVRARYWPEFEIFDFQLFFLRRASDGIQGVDRRVANNICHFNGLAIPPNGRENELTKVQKSDCRSSPSRSSHLMVKIAQIVNCSALTHMTHQMVGERAFTAWKSTF